MKLTTILAAIFAIATPAMANVNFYCNSLPNSTGQVAQIGYTGSLVRGNNDLTITLTNCPDHMFAFLTCGVNTFNMPFGNGILCISPFPPGILKVNQPHLFERGSMSYTLDLNALPPAQSLHFQWWFRDHDAGGARMNTSNAVTCTFE